MNIVSFRTFLKFLAGFSLIILVGMMGIMLASYWQDQQNAAAVGATQQGK